MHTRTYLPHTRTHRLAPLTHTHTHIRGHAYERMSNMSTLNSGRVVEAVVEAWKVCFQRRVQSVTCDPRDPNLQHRKLCSYNAYFRGEGEGGGLVAATNSFESRNWSLR